MHKIHSELNVVYIKQHGSMHVETSYGITTAKWYPHKALLQ